MVEKLTPELLTTDDVLVPVPLHWRRYAWRGFNQAQVIANVIARVHGVEVAPLVVRTKKTVYQAAAGTREARCVNVQDAFVWNARYNPQEYVSKRLVFIDDLMTTGSTLRMVVRSALKAYQQEGLIAPPVAAFVAARVIT